MSGTAEKPVSGVTGGEKSGKDGIVLLGLIAAALLVRVLNTDWLLPYFLEGGEVRLVSVVLEMLRDLDPHPRYFLYGSLYLYLLAGGIWGYAALFLYPEHFWNEIGPETADFVFFRIGQGVSICFSLLSVVLVYRIAGRLFGRRAAVLASLFLVFSPLDISMSQAVKPYTMVTFLGLLTLWFSLMMYRNGTTGSYLAAGAASGLAAGTGYVVPVALVFFAAHFLRGRVEKRSGPARPARLAAAAGAMILAFAAANPYVFIDFPAFWERKMCLLRAGGGWSSVLPGYFIRPFRDLFGIFPVAFGPGVYLGAIWGFARMPGDRLILLGLYPLFLSLSAILVLGYEEPRHFLPVFPFLAISCSFLVVELWNCAGRWQRGIGWLFCLLSVGYFPADLWFPVYRPVYTIFRDAGKWIEAHVEDPREAFLAKIQGNFVVPTGRTRKAATCHEGISGLPDSAVVVFNPEYLVVREMTPAYESEETRHTMEKLNGGGCLYAPVEVFRPGSHWPLVAALAYPLRSEWKITVFRSTGKYPMEEKIRKIEEITGSGNTRRYRELHAVIEGMREDEKTKIAPFLRPVEENSAGPTR